MCMAECKGEQIAWVEGGCLCKSHRLHRNLCNANDVEPAKDPFRSTTAVAHTSYTPAYEVQTNAIFTTNVHHALTLLLSMLNVVPARCMRRSSSTCPIADAGVRTPPLSLPAFCSSSPCGALVL